jgi:glycerol-3-phosphate O-acyltransferase
MYIRRSLGNDTLYTTLLQSYIDAILKGGFNFECFIGKINGPCYFPLLM